MPSTPSADIVLLSDVTTTKSNIPEPSGDIHLDILRNIFHHENFRAIQKRVIDVIATNKDSLAVIPTGGGKSICYWIPGLSSTGITVVITPLMALINDQVSKLRSYGINVCCVNSSMTPEERDIIFHELTNKESPYKFFT